jgi:hypothetical protein
MIGVASAMSRDGKSMAARQFGDYAQSSGSDNAVLLIAEDEILQAVEARVVQQPHAASKASAAALAKLEETE